MADIETIVHNILASKKYRAVYEPTVRRIVEHSYQEHGAERAEHEARNLLHQVWGAYFDIRPDFKKLTKKFTTDLQQTSPQEAVKKVLALHTSTKERLPIIEKFYKEIWRVIGGPPASIIDHACGLNPLTILWMNLSHDARYHAFDIDREEIDFLNTALAALGEKRVHASCSDIMSDMFPEAETVLLLKTLPCLEQQERGIALAVLERQRCRNMVISFPVTGIGGEEKGMSDFYSRFFLELVREKPWRIEKLEFLTELVFIVCK